MIQATGQKQSCGVSCTVCKESQSWASGFYPLLTRWGIEECLGRIFYGNSNWRRTARDTVLYGNLGNHFFSSGVFCSMLNVECQMHCLFAFGFTLVCLWLAFICQRGQHCVVFRPFQRVKKGTQRVHVWDTSFVLTDTVVWDCKQTWVQPTAGKLCIWCLAFCIWH